MLQIMLCGARDVGNLAAEFAEVARDFGAEAWFCQSGSIQHINSLTATWVANSRATVQGSDVCVFVILERFGEITWTHELHEALELGKPFVVLALESAWIRFNTLLDGMADGASIAAEDDRKMVDLLRMISSDYQLTVTPFTYGRFEEALRGELSGLFRHGLALIETRNRRSALMDALSGRGGLNRERVTQLIEIATDDYETNKLERKRALRRLAADSVRDDQLVLDVCASYEQGVQRLGFDLLPNLLPTPPDVALIRALAQIAGTSDDVGLSRRLIGSVTRIDPTLLDLVLLSLRNREEGVRRRAFEGVESNWEAVLQSWGVSRMRVFLRLCADKTPNGGTWLERLEAALDELDDED